MFKEEGKTAKESFGNFLLENFDNANCGFFNDGYGVAQLHKYVLMVDGSGISYERYPSRAIAHSACLDHVASGWVPGFSSSDLTLHRRSQVY